MIDVTKPLYAKIYDFSDWDEVDGMDGKREYIVQKVQGVIFPHIPYDKFPSILYNGGKSVSFEFLPQV